MTLEDSHNHNNRQDNNNNQIFSDSFTIFGLRVLGLAVSHISMSPNCKLMSPDHYFS